jgi:hypothetical protein
MGAGKLIAIIGGILGILSIVLYYVLPDIFSLWRVVAGSANFVYIGGFGIRAGEITSFPFGPEYADDIFLVIVAVLLVAGGAVAIVGGLMENKGIGALGGIIMLAGPILLVVELLLELGFWEGFPEFALWGSQAGADWGVWIGFFMGVGGGILGLIGGASLE